MFLNLNMNIKNPTRMFGEGTGFDLKGTKMDTMWSCPICSKELEYPSYNNPARDDLVWKVKSHILEEHYTVGDLMEMPTLNVEEGQELR